MGLTFLHGLAMLVALGAPAKTVREQIGDATGETFQPTAGTVGEQSWSRFVFPLDGTSSGHWGGDDDGEIDYPIVWDSILLLDSTRRGGEGEILFASPILVYDT